MIPSIKLIKPDLIYKPLGFNWYIHDSKKDIPSIIIGNIFTLIDKLAKKTTNENLTKKAEWAIFVVVFCLVPYFIRVIFYFLWKNELEDFYVSEIDIFAFCLAVMVALFSEVKNLKRLPFKLGESVFLGILMLYILGLMLGVGISLDFEHRIIVFRELTFELLQKNENTDSIIEKISIMEAKKFNLFLGSILAAIITILLSYKTLFSKND